MPDGAPADPDRFVEASSWFRERVAVTRDEWSQLTFEARRHSFTLAGAQQLEVVQTVMASLQRAIDKGTPIEKWRKDVQESLGKKFAGLNPSHLDTAFINANQQAYNAGRFEQMSKPSVTKVLKYWKFSAVLDSRTSTPCTECSGTLLPASHPWWNTHWPPLHHNAIDAQSLIATGVGPKRAGDVSPGTLVLTHMGRWKRVTAVLRKRVSDRPVRVLTTLSGRTLRVTHEHPILRAGTLSWEPAGNLQVGDAIFQEGEQSTGVARASVRNPKDAPPLRHQPSVANSVAPLSRRVPMILPVHLDANELVWKRYVDDIASNAVLCDGPEGAQEVEQIRFLRGEFLAESSSDSCGHAATHIVDTGWVPGSHATLVNGDTLVGISAQSPSPMVFARPSCDHAGVSVGDSQLVAPGSERDAMNLAPSPDDTVAGAVLALKSPHAPTFLPVLDTNQRIESISVREVEWHEETIISIVEERYSGELVDLTVEDDESYVASGIVVHNCRSTVRALTDRMVKRAGGVTDAPRTAIGGEWGLSPAVKAAPLQPDLSKYEQHAAREYEKKQSRMRARDAKRQTNRKLA